MLCGWRTGAVFLADISRDCLMWQIHTTCTRLLCFSVLAAPQLRSLTMRSGLFARGATSAEPAAQIHAVLYTLVLIQPFWKVFLNGILTLIITVCSHCYRAAATLIKSKVCIVITLPLLLPEHWFPNTHDFTSYIIHAQGSQRWQKTAATSNWLLLSLAAAGCFIALSTKHAITGAASIFDLLQSLFQ